MFIRLIILVVAAVILYRVIRQLLGVGQGRPDTPNSGSPQPIDDEMIKDPECGVYFPKKSAVTLIQHDHRIRFCSLECRDRYVARHAGEAAGSTRDER